MQNLHEAIYTWNSNFLVNGNDLAKPIDFKEDVSTT